MDRMRNCWTATRLLLTGTLLFGACEAANAQHLEWLQGGGSIGPMSSSVGPSLAAFNGRLYAAWKGVQNDQGIYWSSFDGANWAPQQLLRGVGTSHGPALASAFGVLVAAWKGIEGDPGVYYSTFDGRGCANQRNISGAKTSVGPSPTVKNGLYAVWKGADNDSTLYWSRYNGGPSWSGETGIGGAVTATGAGIAAPGGYVYIAWRGAGNDQSIYYRAGSEKP